MPQYAASATSKHATMELSASGGRRAALVRALAAGDWPWPLEVRSEAAFVDGICALADACAIAGIDELALAAAVTDENAAYSALARLLLTDGAVEFIRPSTRPAGRADRSLPHRVATLDEAFDYARSAGARGVVLPRWVAEALRAPAGLRVVSLGDGEAGDESVEIVFAEAASSPASSGSLAQVLGADAGALEPRGATSRITVTEPANAALARHFRAAIEEEVWTWPVPEEPRPLVAPAMAFSASRLNGFVKCPRRWFFEYLCDAVEDDGSAAATYGKVFHEALEALHREIRVPADYSGNAILERLHSYLDFAFERNREEFASRLEFEVSRLKAHAVGAHYARWLKSEADDHPMQVESVEALQRWSMGGHEFVGYIDRIDRPAAGGAVTIYDYKTGRIDENPDEYIKKIRRGEEGQLALYYTVRRMRGDDVGRLALISLRDPRDAVWVLALDIVDAEGKAVVERAARSGVVRGVATPDDMAASVDVLLARADMLTKQGVAHFEPGVDPPCAYCAYARGCREQPVDRERVFAR
jgi:hypothetical protein